MLAAIFGELARFGCRARRPVVSRVTPLLRAAACRPGVCSARCVPLEPFGPVCPGINLHRWRCPRDRRRRAPHPAVAASSGPTRRRREPRHGITVGPLGSDVRIAELREEKWVAHDDIFVDEPTRRAPLVAALEPDPGHPLRMNLFEPCVSSNDCNASWQAAPSPSGLFLPAQGDNGRPKLWPSATRKCCVPFL